MNNLVPIKVKIGLRPNGHADHPDWYKLPLAATDEPKKHMPYGWHYDNTSGHMDETLDSPQGQQWGMLFVTPQFAKEALATFPDLVTEMTETEAEDFWDNKHRKHMPETKTNVELLQALNLELDLREKLGMNTDAVRAQAQKAVDPDDETLGINKDLMRHFGDVKVKIGLKVVDSKFEEA